MAGLPNAERAVIGERKITHYLLATDHPIGGAKAALFYQFGFRLTAQQELRNALLEHARSAIVVSAREIGFGMKYTLEGSIATPSRRNPKVRTVWIIDAGASAPRLVTAYAYAGRRS